MRSIQKIFSGMTVKSIILTASLLTFLFISIAGATIIELKAPQEVVQGKETSISGKALPNEAVWLTSSFETSLPVSDGKYSCAFTGVHFPAGDKTFSVTAENVENIRASLSPVLWQTVDYPLKGPATATDGVASFSVSFPATLFGVEIDLSGKKDIGVYGVATDDATSVILKTATSLKINADSDGDFLLNISTEGVPAGEFLIAVDGLEKTVHVVPAEYTPVTSAQKTTKPIPSFEWIECMAAIVTLFIIIFLKTKRN